MPLLSNLASFSRRLLRRQQTEKELDEEVRSHLELLIDEKMKEGMKPAEARRAAQLELGGVEQVKEEVRAVRAGAWLDTLIQDIRFGLRMLRKNPGFTIVVVITLSVGIGANTAIFSVVDAVLLKPLRAPAPSRVVIFTDTNQNGSGFLAADIEFNLWRRETSVLQEVSGYRSASYYLTGVNQPQKVEAILVTGDYFRLFGLPITEGRGFTVEDERGTGRLFENGHVVVLSNGFWKSAFGGDLHVIGKVISLSGNPYEIVGIMAPHVEAEIQNNRTFGCHFPCLPPATIRSITFRLPGGSKMASRWRRQTPGSSS